MQFELSWQPLALYALIPIILMLALLFRYRRQLRYFIFLLPLVLLLIWLQPKISWLGSQPSNDLVFVDLSYLMQGVEPETLKKTINELKQLGYGQEQFVDFNKNKITQDDWQNLFSSDISSRLKVRRFSQNYTAHEEGIYLSAANIYRENQVLLKAIPPQAAIVSVELPPACFEKEPCRFNATILSKQDNTLTVKQGGRVLHSQKINRAAKPISYAVDITFATSEFSYNTLLRFELAGKDMVYTLASDFDVIAMVQKGQPQGSFYFQEVSIFSWRISSVMAENAYLKIYNQSLSLNSQQYDKKDQFRIELFEKQGTNLAGRILRQEEVPTLKLVKAGLIDERSIDKRFIAEKFRRQKNDFYRLGNTIVFILNDPPLRDSVFWPLDNLLAVLEEFSSVLKTQQPPFAAQAIENDKPLTLSSMKALEGSFFAGGFVLQQKYHYIQNYSFFQMNSFTQHEVKAAHAQLIFEPLLSHRERKSIAEIDTHETSSSSVASLVENIKSQKKTLPGVKYQAQITLQIKEIHWYFVIFLLVLCSVLLMSWYSSVERNRF